MIGINFALLSLSTPDEILVKSYFPRSSVIQPSTLDAVKEAISNSNIPTVVIFDLPYLINLWDKNSISKH